MALVASAARILVSTAMLAREAVGGDGEEAALRSCSAGRRLASIAAGILDSKASRRPAEMETMSILEETVLAALATACLNCACVAASKSTSVYGIVAVSMTKCNVSVGATPTTQAPPIGPVYPALHRQSLMLELPGADCELVGQDAQALDELAPMAVEYLPPAHLMHGPLPTLLL